MHITIGMPVYGNVPAESFGSITNFIFECVGQRKFNFDFTTVLHLPVDLARNKIVANLINNKPSDYLLFIDSDMIVPSNLVQRLLDIDADIASALCFKKWPPHYPCIYKFDGENFKSIEDYPTNKIIEVDGVGMACCLIKRKVFETIKQPWFSFKEIVDQEKKVIYVLGEDLVFCKKVKDNNFSIKVDTRLVCGHVGGIIDEKTFKGVSAYGSKP